MLTAIRERTKSPIQINPSEFLVKNHHLIPSKRVLVSNDVSCNNSIYLANQGFDVTTLCPTKYAVRKSRQITRLSQVSVNYVCSDLSEYDLGKSNWDAIIALFCDLSPISRQSFHHRIAQALHCKGIYFTESCMHEANADSASINASTLRNELSQLQIIQIHELEKEIALNAKDTCKAQVIQAIAIK